MSEYHRNTMADIPEDGKVKYNFLGKSGIKVSNICLGTMTFGETHVRSFWTPRSVCQILDRFVAWGGNFIDTADVYGRGNSETIIGNWLQRQQRERFVISTKCRAFMGHANDVNDVGLSRRHITDAIDASLRRLQTDYVDLYQTHNYDNATPLEETYRTLDDLIRCGKIRYAGVSNVSGWQLQKIVQIQEKLGMNPVISLQQQYSLACRESELEAFQVCKNEGIGVLPWSPLKGGLLSGNVRRGQKPTEGRLGWVAQDERRHGQACPSWTRVPDKMFDVIEAAEDIGKRHSRSVAQVCLRWTLQKDVTSSTIIGATKLEQLDQNMAVNGWSLSHEEMQRLDELSAPEIPYPYEMIFKVNSDRVNKHLTDYFIRSMDF